MLAYLLLRGLARLGLPPFVPDIAHIAHVGALLPGLIFPLVPYRSRRVQAFGQAGPAEQRPPRRR